MREALGLKKRQQVLFSGIRIKGQGIYGKTVVQRPLVEAVFSLGLYACLYMCVCRCRYVYVSICECVYVYVLCVNVYLCVYMYICVCESVCM